MNSSINEVAALTRKAAKGAGFSWSMADEVAFATTWLCRNICDGATPVAEHLTKINHLSPGTLKLQSLGSPWRGSNAHGLCAVSAGAALSDLATELNDSRGVCENLMTPVLILPFIAYVCQMNADSYACEASIQCKHFNAKVIAVKTHSWLSNFQSMEPKSSKTFGSFSFTTDTRYHIKNSPLTDTPAKPCQKYHRTTLPKEALLILNDLASNTYAPATEASRQAAGAGNSDND